MQPHTWPEPLATAEEWRQLVKAAETFKIHAPWEWLFEEMLFAIQNPETGMWGFCSVTGNLGAHRALIVYLGEAGLGRYLTALQGMKYVTSYVQKLEHQWMLMETPQLQASFEPSGHIGPLDRQLIKELKMRIRGRNAWPIFRSFKPGRFPWYVNAPEVRFLIVLLEQALRIIEEAFQEGGMPPTLDVSSLPATLSLPSRVFENGAWLSQELQFTPKYAPLPSQPAPDPAELAAWRRQLPLHPVTLQLHLHTMPTPVVEGAMPPYFPYLLLAVEAHQGLILGMETLLPYPALEDLWGQVLPGLLRIFEQANMRPQKIQVASERLYQLLALPLGQLGIKLERAQQMPALENALLSFENWLQEL